jgi:peptidoglycan/LPS O-acetylase OafA/YrhL
VVLVCHTLLTVPRLAELAFHAGQPAPASWDWWLVATPLHIAWEGTGAVYVFFVLSGFVLALPFTRAAGKQPSWRSYYPKRFARLYLPVWAAVALAVAVWALVPRPKTGSGWIDAMGAAVTPERILGDATLLFTDGLVVPPLWSLRWEMWFSLLLPAYVLVSVGLHRAASRAVWMRWAQWGTAVTLIVLGATTTNGVLRDLPLFLLGALLAAHREELASVAARLPAWALPVAASAGVMGMWLPWVVGPNSPAAHVALSAAAVLLVVVALHWGPAVRALSGRAAAWLGTISFSLYLTHEPIVVAAYHLIGPLMPAQTPVGPAALWVSMPVGLVVSLIVAAAFHRMVERPSHRVAQWLGRRFA